MEIAFIISSLSSGGAERVMSVMANHWVQKGHEVTIITLASKEKDYYRLNSSIHRIELNLTKSTRNVFDAIFSNFNRVVKLRKALVKLNPDTMISFIDITNILSILATLGIKQPLIISERIHPGYHNIGRLWSFLRKRLYTRADALVVQTNDIKEWTNSNSRNARTIVIPNPINPDMKYNPETTTKQKNHRVVAMGRLVQQKGFDMLLDAFALCSPECKEWTLTILGEGPERETLVKRAIELGIADRVEMPGTLKDPYPVLEGSDIFVMSSRFEGFPNALLEAMVLGLPVISFDCPSGPADMIRHEINGLLVPLMDVRELTNALERLMRDESLRKEYGEKATEVTDRFSVEGIMGMWEATIEEIKNKDVVTR